MVQLLECSVSSISNDSSVSSFSIVSSVCSVSRVSSVSSHLPSSHRSRTGTFRFMQHSNKDWVRSFSDPFRRLDLSSLSFSKSSVLSSSAPISVLQTEVELQPVTGNKKLLLACKQLSSTELMALKTVDML